MLRAHPSTMDHGSPSGALIFVLVLAFLLYWRGWRRLHQTSGNGISSWRVGSLFLGLFSIWLALGSPLASYDHELLTVHMIQHLLLMTFAPALVLLGVPIKTLSEGLPRFVLAMLTRLFGWTLLRRCGRLLSQPALCWIASAATLVGWHIPSAFAVGLQSNVWHTIEHASFLVAGFLFWWPVIQPWPSVSLWPRWSILVYLFLATVPCDILSGFLVFSERVAYPMYLTAPRRFGMTVLEDQQCAAALMWTCVTIVFLVPAAILTTQLLGTRDSAACEITQSDLPRVAAPQSDPQVTEAL